MDIKNELIKGIIVFFLILNIVTLGFGYYLIETKNIEKKSSYNLELEGVLRKKDSILDEITIVNQSREDIYANLIKLQQNVTAFKIKLNESNKEFASSADQSTYYQNKLNSVQNTYTILTNQKNTLQNKVDIKAANQAALLKAQQDAAAKAAAAKPVRKTRAS